MIVGNCLAEERADRPLRGFEPHDVAIAQVVEIFGQNGSGCTLGEKREGPGILNQVPAKSIGNRPITVDERLDATQWCRTVRAI